MIARLRRIVILLIALIAPIALIGITNQQDRDRGLASGLPSPEGIALDPSVQPSGYDEGWWRTVTARIASEEYLPSIGSQGLQAPNRAHHLRTHFRDHGIEIEPREDAANTGAAWRFLWETTRIGRPGALAAVGSAAPEPNGSRVTYRRPELDEWYVNSRDGLEQGFTVHAAPPGEGPLCLVGRLGGSLRAELRPAKDAVDLLDEHGARVLRYAELHVWDARGDEIPSRLRLDGTELAILVEDRGADYPLVVDPLMTSPAWTAESNQEQAALGGSVATAGDVNGDGYSDVVVGAHGGPRPRPGPRNRTRRMPSSAVTLPRRET
jgi:hypothetical protein